MRELRWIAGLLLALLLPGCGSSSTPTTPATPAPTPTPCTQTTVLQRSGALPSLNLVRLPFSAGTAGRLDVTVDWTFAASPIGVYLVTTGACSIDQFNANSCTFLAVSETTVKPRKFSVPNTAAGNYDLLLVNFADQDESLSVQVVLSSATCPAFASAGRALSMSGLRGPLSESPLR
jgi:uncharacterized protein YceK